jgi:hypothetical protein
MISKKRTMKTHFTAMQDCLKCIVLPKNKKI